MSDSNRKYKISEAWLSSINERFGEQDIPPRQRPWRALDEWSKLCGGHYSREDEERVYAWFAENTKPGSQNMPSLYKGTFYFDTCFWPVYVWVIFGTRTIDIFAALRTMPDGIKSRLKSNEEKVYEFAALIADCLDYAFGIEELMDDQKIDPLCRDYLRSGDKELNATIALLHEERPNSKAIESARMATEMFLKAFITSKVRLTDRQVRREIGHDLEKALDRCLDAEDHAELKLVRADLTRFPNIDERYKGVERTPKELWLGYDLAQLIAATVVRYLSGRDVRPSIKLSRG